MNEQLIADILESIVLDDFEGRTQMEEGRLYTLWENGAWAVPIAYVREDGSFDRDKWRFDNSWRDDDDGQEWKEFAEVLKDGGRAFADDGTPLEDGTAVKALRLAKELRARDSQGRGDLSPSDALTAAVDRFNENERIGVSGDRYWKDLYAVLESARTLCSQPSPWNYDMGQAPRDAIVWIARVTKNVRQIGPGRTYAESCGQRWESMAGSPIPAGEVYAWATLTRPEIPPLPTLPKGKEQKA